MVQTRGCFHPHVLLVHVAVVYSPYYLIFSFYPGALKSNIHVQIHLSLPTWCQTRCETPCLEDVLCLRRPSNKVKYTYRKCTCTT